MKPSTTPGAGGVIVAPSVLACDFANLRGEVQRAAAAGADWMHLDVMDGHFVNNISFGSQFVDAVRRSTTLPIDVHLMIERPDSYIDRYFGAATSISVHAEAAHDVATTLRRIREAGCRAGLAINPDTPLSAALPFFDAIDILLIMTVHPGFGGQRFLDHTMPKVREARDTRASSGVRFQIEVDGGINTATAAVSVTNGADILVAGTSVFGAVDMPAAIASLRGAAD